MRLALITSPKGLTIQRNAGVRVARGDVICFLDDDVTVGPRFIADAVALLEEPALRDVGGITGFDRLSYPQPVSWRWRMRRWLGTTPSLEAGAADRLGRHAPVSFATRSPALRPIGWLPGFCMIYRRAVMDGLAFDEGLPTYGGEDRDFSLAVAARSRLMLASQLELEHHVSPSARASDVRRMYETGFGTGRAFAKRATGLRDRFSLMHYIACEFIIDLATAVPRPSVERLRLPFARARGIVAGWRSLAHPGHGTMVRPVAGTANGATR
jgi:GT2 family glycosyltransferase